MSLSVSEATNQRNESTEPSLCAVFDFETCVLDSKMLSARELTIQQRNRSPKQLISNRAVQEYRDERNHITIALITLPSDCLRQLQMIEVPCLAKTASIYIQKTEKKSNDSKGNEGFIRISAVKPKKARSNHRKQCGQIMKFNPNGMVFAIIFKTFPNCTRYIMDGIYYHAHESTPYVPRFGEMEKEKRTHTSGSFDVFVPDTANAISCTKSLKHYVIKSKAKKHKNTKHKATKRRRKSGERKSYKGVRICETDLGHTKSFSLSSASSIESVTSQLSPLMDS